MAFELCATGEEITVICPHCGRMTEVYSPNLAVTSIGVDQFTGESDGKSNCFCDHCGEDFTVTLRVCAEVEK